MLEICFFFGIFVPSGDLPCIYYHHRASFISTAYIFYYLYMTLDLCHPARFFLVSGKFFAYQSCHIVAASRATFVNGNARGDRSGQPTRRVNFFHPTQQIFKFCVGRWYRGNRIIGSSVENQSAQRYGRLVLFYYFYLFEFCDPLP